ncbi:MAG: flavin reductase family protein [Paracoccaceae bacterium]
MTDAPEFPPMRHFEPGPGSDREFRDALSRFGTGVTIVTTATEQGPIGITANSFTSVSLDPPLVLWSAALKSKRFPHFADAEHLAIHVLAQDQDELCWAFSKSKDAFHDIDWMPSEHGVPLIQGCLARFECQNYARYDGGDHAIIVSRVMNISFREGDPLLFFGGSMGRFAQSA